MGYILNHTNVTKLTANCQNMSMNVITVYCPQP